MFLSQIIRLVLPVLPLQYNRSYFSDIRLSRISITSQSLKTAYSISPLLSTNYYSLSSPAPGQLTPQEFAHLIRCDTPGFASTGILKATHVEGIIRSWHGVSWDVKLKTNEKSLTKWHIGVIIQYIKFSLWNESDRVESRVDHVTKTCA